MIANQNFSRNSFIVLALVAAASVIPHLFPLSSVSSASELLVNVANHCAITATTLASLCDNSDNPCPPSLPPPPPPPPVIECPPPPPLPLPPPLALPPPLTENGPTPLVPPICGACNSPPTGDIGQGTPPPPSLPPPTTCAVCEPPPSGGIVYGSPPPPTMYPGYGGGGGVYPPRPNIVTPYFPYDGLPPRTASTGRSTPLFVYFWMAVLLPLLFIM